MKIQNKEKMVKKNIDSGEKNQESIPKIMFKKILNQESNMKRIKIHNKNTVRQFHSTKQELLMKTKIQNSMNQESTMSTKVNNLKQSFGKTKHRAIMPFVFIFSMFLLLFNCPRIIEPGPEQPLVIPLTTNAMDVLDASNALQINYASGDTNSNVTKNITLATNDIEKKGCYFLEV